MSPEWLHPSGDEFPLTKANAGSLPSFQKPHPPRLTGGSPGPLLGEAALVVKGWGQEGT